MSETRGQGEVSAGAAGRPASSAWGAPVAGASPPRAVDGPHSGTPRGPLWPIGVGVFAVVLIIVVAIAGPFLFPHKPGTPGITPARVPIKHVVIVMMENHPFDNYFGTYCSATGPFCRGVANGIPPGTCVPYNTTDPALGCVRPYPFTAHQLSTPDLPHYWESSVQSINGGLMNGFYSAEGSGQLPFGYYNGSTVPLYWDLAEQYALGDNFFTSALSYSLPNHWYLLAGQVPTLGINSTSLGTVADRHTYLDEANKTKTVQDLLNITSNVSWKFYDWSLLTYGAAINQAVGPSVNSAYDYWNPLASRAESYTSWYNSHFVARDQLFADASQGQLPNISWVIPSFQSSDHPPANISAGEAFVSSVVDAVESSPNWNSTAIFLTWDDYGGFYDHVAPPRIDPLGLSFRVPLIVVSPYTPRGAIIHDVGYFDSLLRFVEWKFGLGCIAVRDCNAPLPLGYFDFSQKPRSPVLFPTGAANATYPMPLTPSLGSLASPSPTGVPCEGGYCGNPYAWDSGPPPANAAVTAVD